MNIYDFIFSIIVPSRFCNNFYNFFEHVFKIRRVCCQIQEVMWLPVQLVPVMRLLLCASENLEWTWPSFRLRKNLELFNICSNQTIRRGL